MPGTTDHQSQRAGNSAGGQPGASYEGCKLARRAALHGLTVTREEGVWKLHKPGGSAPFESRRAADLHAVLDAHREAMRR